MGKENNKKEKYFFPRLISLSYCPKIFSSPYKSIFLFFLMFLLISYFLLCLLPFVPPCPFILSLLCLFFSPSSCLFFPPFIFYLCVLPIQFLSSFFTSIHFALIFLHPFVLYCVLLLLPLFVPSSFLNVFPIFFILSFLRQSFILFVLLSFLNLQ